MRFSDEYQYEVIAASGIKIWSKINPKLVFLWSGKDWNEIVKVIQLLKFLDIERIEEGEFEEVEEEKNIMDSQNEAHL